MVSYKNETTAAAAAAGKGAKASQIPHSGFNGGDGVPVTMKVVRKAGKDIGEGDIVEFKLRLDRDERSVIDPANILAERTRHAKPMRGTYWVPDYEDETEDEETEDEETEDEETEDEDEDVDEGVVGEGHQDKGEEKGEEKDNDGNKEEGKGNNDRDPLMEDDITSADEKTNGGSE